MADYRENFTYYEDNTTYDYNFNTIEPTRPKITPRQIVALVCYFSVFLLGVPGNALVVWVTGFRMPRSVTSMWFLNLALADLLCCLSLPLLMVPLAHDYHWYFGPVACKLLKGLIYLVMYCSVLLLVAISLDRWLLVYRPIWCQNRRRPWLAAWLCAGVWFLALLGSIPEFIYVQQVQIGLMKLECLKAFTHTAAWAVTTQRFVLGFLLPCVFIVGSHWVVYKRARLGSNATRSKRTLRVIMAVALSFFLCWLPLHVMDFLVLLTPRDSEHKGNVNLAHALTLCLAYFNSCLNPLLYVFLGRGFKESMTRSLRSVFNFISEDPMGRRSTTKTTTSTANHSRNDCDMM